jgi:N-acetylmuramoyl-L-alanine amidase
MPAILIEMGYLSNPDQEKQLAGNTLQTAIAQAILEAVVRFRDGAGEAPSR